MDLPVNHNPPLVMHIDLNSCFATVEQQANPLLRGKPVAVAAYDSPSGCILSPSIEAKQKGVKTGMRVKEGRLLCPDLIVRLPDPPKYRDVHLKFRKIFGDYSPQVFPKSIDEAVIDFEGMEEWLRRRRQLSQPLDEVVSGQLSDKEIREEESKMQKGWETLISALVDIGMEIKQRMRKEIGEWIRCNIGIGTNRFLAKLASGLHKPDGLDVITDENLQEVYGAVKLVDLYGINTRWQARLNMAGIFTPLQFWEASEGVLRRQVFRSVLGYYWYLRLRGWETDGVEFGRRSFGQSYALKEWTDDRRRLSRLLMKLVEKMGRRLRRDGYAAQGVQVACSYADGTHWHKGKKFERKLLTTADLYRYAQLVFNYQPEVKKVAKLAVSCYDLKVCGESQLGLFDLTDKEKAVSQALDEINDRYGEYVISPALMMGLGSQVIGDRIAFGGMSEMEEM